MKTGRLGAPAPCAALARAPLFWSGSVVVGRALREAVDPVALSLYRWSIAGLLVLPLAARPLWRHRAERLRGWPVIGGHGAACHLAGAALIFGGPALPGRRRSKDDPSIGNHSQALEKKGPRSYCRGQTESG